MKKYGYLVFIPVLFVIFFFPDPKTKIVNYPSKGESIVAFGDSLVQGVGSSKGKDFVSVLSGQTGKKIVNLGVSGNTTTQGLARVEDIKQYKPKVVLILLGGNDFLHKTPQEETFANLEKIITAAQSYGAVVVLLGVQGGLFLDPYAPLFKKLSKEKGTLYVPDVLEGLVGDARYMSDSIHPNDIGYEKIAIKVYPELQKAIK